MDFQKNVYSRKNAIFIVNFIYLRKLNFKTLYVDNFELFAILVFFFFFTNVLYFNDLILESLANYREKDINENVICNNNKSENYKTINK